MATIRARKQSDGTTRNTAIVRIRKRKTIIYQEYKTFALRIEPRRPTKRLAAKSTCCQ